MVNENDPGIFTEPKRSGCFNSKDPNALIATAELVHGHNVPCGSGRFAIVVSGRRPPSVSRSRVTRSPAESRGSTVAAVSVRHRRARPRLSRL